METHQDPDNAPSDGPNMNPLSEMENLLKQLTGSVLWYDTIIGMEKNNIDTIIEVGPKQVLSKLVQKIQNT